MSTVLNIAENTKTCKKCGVSKAISCFDSYSRSRLHPDCKDCRAIDNRNKVKLIAGGRVCLACQRPKLWDEFAKDVHGFNQKTATCKVCRNIKSKKIYKENPIVRRSGMKNRPDKLKRLYGVTWEQIVRVLDNQFGRCANRGCGKEIFLTAENKKDRAVIDHNHGTGKFRALLCIKCNLDLGMVEKDGNRFAGLMEYLAKHN